MTEGKKTYIIQQVLVDPENDLLCHPKCRGFVDNIRYPVYAASCKLFITPNELFLNSMHRNENGTPITKFSRRQECVVKEQKEAK